MNILAIVPARGGSKGIKNKNLALCAGKPLIDWTLEDVDQSSLITRTVLSSDDEAILSHHRGHQCLPMQRPAEFAQDSTPTEAVIYDVVERCGYDPDIIVLLQPTSPVRHGRHIDEAIQMLDKTGAQSVLSVVPSHAFIWEGPEPFSITYNWARRPRRQDMPLHFEENGAIYVFTREHWERRHNRIGGKIALYVMPEEARIQVDTPFDLWMAGKILESNPWHE